MEHISAHMTGRAHGKERVTERGELMRYFMEKLNRDRLRDALPLLTMARMGRTLQGIGTRDLYYLRSVCDGASNFSKKFWWEINPKLHALQPSQLTPQGKKVSKRVPRTRG